jgi:integrase/recombinase XerC
MPTTTVTTLSRESIDNFLSSLSARGVSPRTRTAYESDLNLLLAAMGPEVPIDQATTWLNSNRGLWAPKTTARRLTTIRSWATWAGLDVPSLRNYRAPMPARAQPHPLPEGIPGVLAMINSSTDDRRKALIALCGLAGLRVGEALSTRPIDISVGRRNIHVDGKGAKHRDVPLSDACLVHLRNRYNAVVLDAEGIYTGRLIGYSDRPARAAITKAGVDALGRADVSSHDLRATFLTAAYEKTKDIRAVQMLAGHSTSAQTELYIGLTLDTLRNAAEV